METLEVGGRSMGEGKRPTEDDSIALALSQVDTLYRTALRLTRNPSDAEDLVHEAFLRGYRYFRKLTDADACTAVLYTIVVNVWRKDRRRARRELPGQAPQQVCGTSDPEAAVLSKTFLVAADATAIQHRLHTHLSFRPIVPQVEQAGFRLRGAGTLTLMNRTAAAISFGREGRLYSLLSLPAWADLPHLGKRVEMGEISFHIFRQQGYTFVLWVAQGLLYVLVAAEDEDELLEYAALCARQMRTPLSQTP